MKPESSLQNSAPEQLVAQERRSPEKTLILETPETTIDGGAETFERKSDTDAIRADIGLATVLPTPITGTKVDGKTDDITLSGNPVVANDDDLIEKEWVDKAKKIVEQTRNDPHLQDEEVNKLQADYLKKRFGRELGAAQ
jgi:hypothetical protein